MTYRICYWDAQAGAQAERDATPEEAAEIDARKLAPPAVPQSVTRRQGMAVLIKYGLDTQVDAALSAQLTAATNAGNAAAILSAKFAINDWKESQEFRRAWPLIAAMKQVFGWTDAYIDGLFVEAAGL